MNQTQAYPRRLIAIILSVLMLTLQTGFDWPQFGLNAQHSGNHTEEVLINPTNVSSLSTLFHVTLPVAMDGAPVFIQTVDTISGTRDMLFVATTAGHLFALDAYSGARVWMKQNPPGTCKILNGSNPCYTNSSPAIDPNRQYVYSYGLDGYVHKYSVFDGSETIDSHWPETATLKPYNEKGSSPLTIATAGDGTSYLYVTHASYPTPQELGDYQGHLTAINLGDGTQHVFNAVCSDQAVHFTNGLSPDCAVTRGGIWARANVVYNPSNNRIYLTTGNAPYSPTQHYWGDTVMELNPDGTGSNGNPLDTYTPSDYQYLENQDLDIGSTNVAIFTAALTSTVQHVGVQGGKDSKLRLLNLDNLSGQGGPGHIGGELGIFTLPQKGEVITAPAVWVDPVNGNVWLIIINPQGATGMRVTYTPANTPTLTTGWTYSVNGGTSPVIANNIVFYASNSIRAINPRNGQLLWSSPIGLTHWQSPIVANGVVYIADKATNTPQGSLWAFSLYGLRPLPYKVLLPIVIR